MITLKGINKIYREGNGIEPDQYVSFVEDGSDNILIEAFSQLGVEILPEPTPEPKPDPTPEPTPEPKPEPTPEPNNSSSSGGCQSTPSFLMLFVLLRGVFLKLKKCK